ncbi:MAG: thiol:disulfide interchange protein DsbA/DsbL [Cellvibrionaceae bacterium]
MRAIPASGIALLCGLVALCVIAISPTQAQPLAASKYVEGQHYQLIKNPVTPKNQDKIEVTEVFWYGCPHCNQFRPVFENWKKQQGDDVAVKHSPAIWNKPMIVHAHIFYTAKAFRLDEKMHKEIFDAMHMDNKKLVNPKQIATLFEKHGISKEQFDKTFDSFGVKSQVQQASARARNYGITGTPEVIVNGKYRISGRMVQGGQAEVLKVADFLVKKERAAKKS